MTLLFPNYSLHTRGLSTTWLRSLDTNRDYSLQSTGTDAHEGNNTVVLAYADVGLSLSSEALNTS